MYNSQKRITPSTSICLCTSSHTHQLDHLAVLANLLDVPLLLTDPSMMEFAQKYYPYTNTLYVEERNCSLSFLAENFDTLFVSCKHWARELALSMKELFQKNMRFFYCPHGNSDKGHLNKESDLLMHQDLTFIYGNHMKDMLEKRGVLSSLNGYVFTGNYRLNYYLKHKEFYTTLVEKEVFAKFEKKQPTLLYAPTWKDPEESSSFFTVCESLLKHLPDEYNLLIKLHPNLEEEQPERVFYLMGKYEEKKNVLFLSKYPLVYPILAKTDIYLGDFSSVGYDMLFFNKPMYFFNHTERDLNQDEGLLLHKCGIQIPKNHYQNIYPFLFESLEKNQIFFEEQRKHFYDYAFIKDIHPEKIKENISEVLENTKALFS